MSGYLIYHPRRAVTQFDTVFVYHDNIHGNQDPYIWNQQFLHTYCHITQMRANVADINFWVSGDSFPNFSHLYCDLVFVVKEKSYWHCANDIDHNDNIVDNHEAYNDHYRWAHQHPFKRRRRYTLKADSTLSFQPQNLDKELINVVPFLINQGMTIEGLRKGLRSGFNSKPLPLEPVASSLYHWLEQSAEIKLKGMQLQNFRHSNPQLASP